MTPRKVRLFRVLADDPNKGELLVVLTDDLNKGDAVYSIGRGPPRKGRLDRWPQQKCGCWQCLQGKVRL